VSRSSAYFERFEVVVRNDDKSGHERTEAAVAARVGGAGNGGQSPAVEAAGSEHMSGLVQRNLLDVVRPLACQFDRRLERLHA